MRKTLKIALREYKAAVRTKAFLIMVMLMPVMMSGGLIVTKMMEDRVDTRDKRIAIVDRSGVVAESLVQAAQIRNTTKLYDQETGKKIQPAYLLEVVPPNVDDPEAQRLELSTKVRNKALYAFVEIGKDVTQTDENAQDARVEYYGENAFFHEARKWLQTQISNQVRGIRLAAAGLDAKTVDKAMRGIGVEALEPIAVDAATGEIKQAERSSEGIAIGLPMGLMMLMFMMIAVAATPLVNAVLEEKMQRIAEVLMGSARPFELMLGKLLGTVAVSLTVVSIYVAGGLVLAFKTGVTDRIPLGILPWFVVYQISAILMFGALFIAIGSACNDLKEAQSMMMPVWLLAVVPLMLWLPVVKEPLSSFATGLSLVPICTPMLMLLRQATPTAIPAWQPWVGLVGVLVFTTLIVWAAGRVFRIGILMQGKPPKLSDLVRWAVRG